MKHKSRLVACLLPCLGFFGCTDANGRFDDFGQRINDAAPPEPDAPPIEELPDLTVYWLMTIAVVVLPDKPLLFYTEINMTVNDDGTGEFDAYAQPLTVADRQPVGDLLVSEDIAVNNAGELAAPFPGEVPGAANPISGQPIEMDPTALSVIKNVDFFCGDVIGSVTKPTIIDLEGSTIGGIRIEEGTYGDDLPDPIAACPEETPPDAGVPDAGAPDASPPDADIADADVADAEVPDAD